MITELEPKILWKYFSEISAVPRQSKHEEKIVDYLIDFAEKRSLAYKKDSAGNVVIIKNASAGKESNPTAVIQSHIDMVCEKNEDSVHDFLKDPLELFIDGDFVKARGTTLGADDGIGAAAALALLDSGDIDHGSIECLFTVDEETGLTGANALEEGFISGSKLINLDSEDEGAVYIGCAGGKTTELYKKTETVCNSERNICRKIFVGGLKGGHSGLAINSGLGNAVLLLARFLWNLNEKINYNMSGFSGGDKHNAIPREACAAICFPEEELPIFETEIIKFCEIFKKEFSVIDPGVYLKESPADFCKKVLSEKDKSDFLNLVYSFPHGVYSMSPDIKGLVQTSTNLASVSIRNEEIHILTSQRSSVESSIHDMAGKVIAHSLLANYDYISKDPYPAWTPDPSSELLKTAVEVHRSLFNKDPEIKAVHAGLECGIIGKKFHGIEMISIGPDVFGAHTPDERVRISSVANFWKFFIKIVEKI